MPESGHNFDYAAPAEKHATPSAKNRQPRQGMTCLRLTPVLGALLLLPATAVRAEGDISEALRFAEDVLGEEITDGYEEIIADFRSLYPRWMALGSSEGRRDFATEA